MNRAIYFIEDQEALTPYILLARREETFPGCTIFAADSVDDAIEWCGSYEGEVVFVVDSRMVSELLPEYLKKALQGREIAIQDISHLVEDEVLTGALGTIVLRYLKPHCRIVLLTAFFRRISQLRQENPVLDRLLDQSVNVSLPKTNPEVLTQTIQAQLLELSRARSQGQTK